MPATHKARNASIRAKYNLPATLTGEQIAALTHGAFANHSFTLTETGEHITAISAIYIQLLDTRGIPRNVRKSEDCAAFAKVMGQAFAVAPEFDPTW